MTNAGKEEAMAKQLVLKLKVGKQVSMYIVGLWRIRERMYAYDIYGSLSCVFPMKKHCKKALTKALKLVKQKGFSLQGSLLKSLERKQMRRIPMYSLAFPIFFL